MGIGLAGVALNLLLLSMVNSVWLFAGGYFIVGVFLAALGPNAAAHIAAEVPAEVRGSTYGILQAANTAGAFVAPLAAGVIGAYLGFRWVFASLALATAGGALVMFSRSRRGAVERPVLEARAAGEER